MNLSTRTNDRKVLTRRERERERTIKLINGITRTPNYHQMI